MDAGMVEDFSTLMRLLLSMGILLKSLFGYNFKLVFLAFKHLRAKLGFLMRGHIILWGLQFAIFEPDIFLDAELELQFEVMVIFKSSPNRNLEEIVALFDLKSRWIFVVVLFEWPLITQLDSSLVSSVSLRLILVLVLLT